MKSIHKFIQAIPEKVLNHFRAMSAVKTVVDTEKGSTKNPSHVNGSKKTTTKKQH